VTKRILVKFLRYKILLNFNTENYLRNSRNVMLFHEFADEYREISQKIAQYFVKHVNLVS
jgi:hypothetical protein